MLRGSSAGAAVLSMLVVLGCSDPAAPPPRGSATVQLSSVSPPVSGKSCPSQGNPIFLGESGVGPSGSAKGKVLTDDEGGASVSCSISGGDEVKFSGQLKKAGGSWRRNSTVDRRNRFYQEHGLPPQSGSANRCSSTRHCWKMRPATGCPAWRCR